MNSHLDVPKIVALDCNALVNLCEKGGDSKNRIEGLLAKIEKQRGKVLLPTPAIAEFLVLADQASIGILDALQKKSSVKVASFDLAAAFENAQLDAAALGRGDKKDGSDAAWQKVKIDRQIVAIAKANGARLIISDDGGIKTNAARVGIRAVAVNDLPIPDSARQVHIPFKSVRKVPKAP